MRSRLSLVVLAASGLSACASLQIPTINLAGTSLPRWAGFGAADQAKSDPTTPYPLSATELASIKTEFSSAFRDGRTLQFGPMTARRRSSGGLVICGLVSVHQPDGTHSGMTLFDGTGSFETPDGRLAFTPKRLAGGNADPVDVYADCREAGAL